MARSLAADLARLQTGLVPHSVSVGFSTSHRWRGQNVGDVFGSAVEAKLDQTI
jgi:hypothetical protein